MRKGEVQVACRPAGRAVATGCWPPPARVTRIRFATASRVLPPPRPPRPGGGTAAASLLPQQGIRPGGILRRQGRVRLGLVSDVVLVPAVVVAPPEQRLQVERYVRVGLTKRDPDGRQGLPE